MILDLINKIFWAIAIILIITNSIYFSVKLKWPQLKIIKSIKSIKRSKNQYKISPSDTLVMALSSKIGVGSLSGTALCIYYGGLGTIFWIFTSTIFLSILTYIENALSIIYKDKTNKSGPYYYITKGLKKPILGSIYAITILIAYTFLFPSIQNNTIITLSTSMFNINKVLISLIITTVSGITILKGIKGISEVCNKIFPIMMLIFIVIGSLIIIKNINILPNLFILIIKSAFNKNSISGGVLHTIIIAFQKTVFANESGVGTSAIISGSTDNKDYYLQAQMGVIQTFFINIIVLGITSIIIITSDLNSLNIINGIELTKEAFSYHLGTTGEQLLLLLLSLFSFSTIITVYYYGESSLMFLTHNKKLIVFLKIITIVSIFVGGIINATTIWSLIDIFLAILTIINMYAIHKLKETIITKLSKK